jgi:sugar lactone lactonase YvrE
MRSTSVLALATLLAAAPALADQAPTVINLPDGFRPEGITNGSGNTLYVTAFDSGAVLKVDARTGTVTTLVAAQAGRQGLGVKLDDHNRLFVAGGGTGHAYVYDARTGANLADFTLATGETFVNDVILTRDAAYFTDSSQARLYRLPLGKHGQLPPAGSAQTIALAGDWQQVPGQFNANGIELAPGCDDALIVVNSFTGQLFKVDPRTGFARLIDLGTANVVNGDGLVLRGNKLYVVENFSNQVVVVKLKHGADSGTVIQTITNPKFDIPATGALLGDSIIVTNARFNTPFTPTTPYWLTRASIHD